MNNAIKAIESKAKEMQADFGLKSSAVSALHLAVDIIKEAQPIDEYAGKLHSLELELTGGIRVFDADEVDAHIFAYTLSELLSDAAAYGLSLGDIMEKAVELKAQ